MPPPSRLSARLHLWLHLDEPALKEMLHNEIRMQTMPENQDSLSEAITELRGFPLSDCSHHCSAACRRLARG